MKHQQTAAPKFFSKKRCIIFSVIMLLLIVIAVITQPKIADKLSSLINSMRLDRSPGEAVFPDIDTANLSPTRQKIISLAKTEFKAQSAGTKFSQGAEEAWCANFVSWIMYQAGAPLKNPHTGGWRIPGTFTLREYYEANGRFKLANSGYQPLPGDVAIYRAQAATILTMVIFQNISGSLAPGTGTFMPNNPAIIVGIVSATVITVSRRIVSFRRVSITAR